MARSGLSCTRTYKRDHAYTGIQIEIEGQSTHGHKPVAEKHPINHEVYVL